MPETAENTTSQATTGPVVCGYDGSRDAVRAVAWAATWARDHHTRLEVISADRAVGRVAAFDETARANVEGAMRDQLAELTYDGDVSFRVIADRPVGAPVQSARGASPSVVGSRGLTAREAFSPGSPPAGVAYRASRPVILIPPRTPESPSSGPVVLAADGSAANDPAAAFAFAGAERRGTS